MTPLGWLGHKTSTQTKIKSHLTFQIFYRFIREADKFIDKDGKFIDKDKTININRTLS